MGIDLDKINSVLEIGCGLGFVSYSIALQGKKVDVVESSEWASKWMQEAYGERPGFRVFFANIETIDKSLLLDRYDFIFANHVWEHLINPMDMLEFCFNKLNSGGKMFLIVPDKEREKNMHHVHEWAYDMDCLKLWFDKAGFKNIVVGEWSGSKEEVEQLGGQHIRIVGEKP